ncbi:uncharacterized protein PFL1_05305 [Pseudozyma flocculosa PF-1]|uniref:Uncharacterized protein n=2 Tax=Pseudozyma flocculosa TaxID=84751 RepID=A0A5C3FED8_9BASI|nr:uncharacterized protein PFL1_05305 [Pseudozyma flocculosa PF-1]EPQ27021.1 hypothetical protein PFL1_05305 [Pseudozyma flocculosa PF-1]SPO42017.1 uncharacterized protein PSFLO_07500 [Pseudozyma flocculosa]
MASTAYTKLSNDGKSIRLSSQAYITTENYQDVGLRVRHDDSSRYILEAVWQYPDGAESTFAFLSGVVVDYNPDRLDDGFREGVPSLCMTGETLCIGVPDDIMGHIVMNLRLAVLNKYPACDLVDQSKKHNGFSWLTADAECINGFTLRKSNGSIRRIKYHCTWQEEIRSSLVCDIAAIVRVHQDAAGSWSELDFNISCVHVWDLTTTSAPLTLNLIQQSPTRKEASKALLEKIKPHRRS